MKWLLMLVGAGAVNNPNAGDKVLSLIILVVAFLLPIMPLILAHGEVNSYKAYRQHMHVRVVMYAMALIGLGTITAIACTIPLVATTYSVGVAGFGSMAVSLLVLVDAIRRNGA